MSGGYFFKETAYLLFLRLAVFFFLVAFRLVFFAAFFLFAIMRHLLSKKDKVLSFAVTMVHTKWKITRDESIFT